MIEDTFSTPNRSSSRSSPPRLAIRTKKAKPIQRTLRNARCARYLDLGQNGHNYVLPPSVARSNLLEAFEREFESQIQDSVQREDRF
jgi:hypothetical protein